MITTINHINKDTVYLLYFYIVLAFYLMLGNKRFAKKCVSIQML